MNVLRWQRYQAPGWWRTCFDDTLALTGVRPSGFYLRESTLRKVARMVGHLTAAEAVDFAAQHTFQRAADDDSDEDEDEGIDVGDVEDVDDFHAHVSGGLATLPMSSFLIDDDEDEEDEEEELCRAVDVLALRLPT